MDLITATTVIAKQDFVLKTPAEVKIFLCGRTWRPVAGITL